MQIGWNGKTLFTLGLLTFVSFILYWTLELGRVARLVPFKVVIPTLGLLLVQLLLDLIPQWAEKYQQWERIDLFRVKPSRERTERQVSWQEEGTKGEMLKGSKELLIFFWIGLFLIFISFFGFFIAIPFYTFLYVRERAGEGWFLALGLSAGTGSLIYGVFTLLLGARLYEGLLWRWLGM